MVSPRNAMQDIELPHFAYMADGKCIVRSTQVIHVHPIKTVIAERMNAITFCLCFNPKYFTRYRYPLNWLNASTCYGKTTCANQRMFCITYFFSIAFFYFAEQCTCFFFLLYSEMFIRGAVQFWRSRLLERSKLQSMRRNSKF